jgi:hypothetical protein
MYEPLPNPHDTADFRRCGADNFGWGLMGQNSLGVSPTTNQYNIPADYNI